MFKRIHSCQFQGASPCIMLSNIDNDKTKVDNVDEHLSFVIGKKVGMTQLFDEDGSSYPVTVISVEPNTVTQLKTVSKDGYSSVQLGFETITEKK